MPSSFLPEDLPDPQTETKRRDRRPEHLLPEGGQRNFVDPNVPTPRMAVEPDFVDVAYQPLTKISDRAKLVNVREVKSVSPGEVVIVTLEGNEQTLKADGVVVATGSVQASPLMKDSTGKSKEERRAQFVAFRDSVKTSKGVLVVGGGTTGVELASEIATDFPGVKTTLISKSELLLRNTASREKMHKMAMKALKKLGVTVITGDYVEGLKEDYSGEPKTFSTLKGVNIEADLVVICAGGQPCIPFPTAPEAVDDDTRGLVVTNAMLCEKLSDDPTKPIWAVGGLYHVRRTGCLRRRADGRSVGIIGTFRDDGEHRGRTLKVQSQRYHPEFDLSRKERWDCHRSVSEPLPGQVVQEQRYDGPIHVQKGFRGQKLKKDTLL
ncbi:hypothetical protein THAOC_00155, partial [Thalassiosira oceanica]